MTNEALAQVERLIADCKNRIERQREVVALRQFLSRCHVCHTAELSHQQLIARLASRPQRSRSGLIAAATLEQRAVLRSAAQ